ncbi:hypothetical protein PC117_g23288 [Phytophthora cactorum]|uniref:Uncharacterized protein n=1 Tax=Phytophthora cactorum TaxID=29920 RepID=A0A8T1B6T5_9STRA|nr:hypothetical protein PC117_g23288 [Phytophthora cactorum]
MTHQRRQSLESGETHYIVLIKLPFQEQLLRVCAPLNSFSNSAHGTTVFLAITKIRAGKITEQNASSSATRQEAN